MEKNSERAKEIVEENIYMVIASASKDGLPWVSPVFFAHDKDYNLFWVSNKNSRHSTLLRVNPKAAIVIFDSRAPEGEADGVYFEVNVEELIEEKKINHAISVLDKRVTKDEFRVEKMEEVIGEEQWRIYQAIPTKIYKLSEGSEINGQYVDSKVEINLK